MKTVLCLISFMVAACGSLQAQNPEIYTLYSFVNNQNDSIAFAALSDNYRLSEDPDSSAIPSLEDMTENEADYLVLDSVFRKRFLAKMKIAENDKVFIYDYFQHKLTSFPVKDLKVVATLNIYGATFPYSQNVYMYGFEINPKPLKGHDPYFNHTFVHVGKENPFDIGKVKPIIWKEILPQQFPSIGINIDSTTYNSSWTDKLKNPTSTHKYNTDGLEYFIQDFIMDDRLFARRLIVLNSTKNLICERIFFDGEGSTPAPLNTFSEPFPIQQQFTGKLFKNRPPVIFGFTDVSFGCPSITFLKPSENDLYINCDNWH